MNVPSDTPIVVGVAQVVHRPGEGFIEQSSTALMVEASRRALHQTGVAERLGAILDEVLVPHGTWPEPDPGRAISDALGAVGARSIRSELGVAQHALISRAAIGVQSGAIRAAVVVGGENRWSEVVAAKRGAASPAPPEAATSGEPDEVLAPAAWPIAQVEIDRNLTTAAHQYAIIESAYRHHLGISIERRQEQIGAQWARMAEVATRSEAAWNRSGMTAQEILEPSPSNRLIAAPYRKHLVTQWNVDQAAAVVVTSVGVARELGVPEELWVFPLVVAISDDIVPVCERAELHRWPGAAITAQAAFRSADVGVDDLSAVDLYSCFPIAVEVQAQEMGLGLSRPLTITGGMTFSGGPFNNYSLQAAAAMVELLRRSDPGDIGLTTAVSGFLTKVAVTLWSNAPRRPFEAVDVSDAVAAATPRRQVEPALTGPAVVVGATVVPSADSRLEVIAVVESAELLRTIAISDDQELARRALDEDAVGWPVQVDAPGRFRSA